MPRGTSSGTERMNASGGGGGEKRRTKKNDASAEAKKRAPSNGSERTTKQNTKKCRNTRQKHSLYELLDVDKNATQSDITKAYRKRALSVHPDKLRQKATAEKATFSEEEATKNFQALQMAYEILKDPKKRKLYDETGIIGADDISSGTFEDAYEYYRAFFPKVTEKDILKLRKEYINSNDEKEDITDFYNTNGGDLTHFFECIPFSEADNQERYKKIIEKLIANKRIASTPVYVKTSKKFADIAKKYEKMCKKESRKAAESMDDLMKAIQANQLKRRVPDFLDGLEQRYKKGKK